ncbi:MAG: MFS transporter [Muribaculaceae bacterium]|nr:MFS transporter [Muribaculaceae bacterium]
MVSGVQSGGKFYEGGDIVINGNDTIVRNHSIVSNDEGIGKAQFGELIKGVNSLSVDGVAIENPSNIEIKDYLSRLTGPFKLTEAAIVATSANGKVSVEDATSYEIADASKCSYETKTVLNSATPQYNDAGNWVGLLYAVQALGSVCWALLLPRFKSRKFSYSLSLVLAGGGFMMLAFVTNPWILFISFILIGCGWAAMLAWPFTILTNSLTGGNIGAYLGLFNCTICIPQIIAALAGGWILSLMSKPGELAPEYMMMFIAGISIVIGAICVFIIKEGKGPKEAPVETPVISEQI